MIDKYKIITKFKNIILFDYKSTGDTKKILISLLTKYFKKNIEFVNIVDIIYDGFHIYLKESGRNLNLRCSERCNKLNVFQTDKILFNTLLCNAYIICLYISIKQPSVIRKCRKILLNKYNNITLKKKYEKFDSLILVDMKFYDMNSNQIISWKEYDMKLKKYYSNTSLINYLKIRGLEKYYNKNVKKHLYDLSINQWYEYFRISSIEVNDVGVFIDNLEENYEIFFRGSTSDLSPILDFELFSPWSIASLDYYKISFPLYDLSGRRNDKDNYKEINKLIKFHNSL